MQLSQHKTPSPFKNQLVKNYYREQRGQCPNVQQGHVSSLLLASVNTVFKQFLVGEKRHLTSQKCHNQFYENLCISVRLLLSLFGLILLICKV